MLQLELHTFVGSHKTEGFIKPERVGLMIKLGVQHIPIATYKTSSPLKTATVPVLSPPIYEEPRFHLKRSRWWVGW